MTILDGIIGIIAVALLIGVLVLARLAQRIGRAADEVGAAARSVVSITPSARDLIDRGRTELDALRALTSTTALVAEDVRAVSEQASGVTSQLLRGFESEVMDRYRAIFAGIREGVDVLRRFRSVDRSNGSRTVAADDFEHVQD